MKYNTKTAGGASAAEKISVILGKVDDFQYELHKLNCLATVADNASNDIFCGPRDPADRPGCYYIGDPDRKVLGFATNEVLAISNGTEDTLDELVDSLREVHDMLKRSEPARQPEPARSAALEDVIEAWKNAYAVWVATSTDGGVPTGTPEAAAEEKALLTLAAHPCVTLADVQRKSALFLENHYLRDSASDFTIELLASFKSAKIV
ncbi:hypothetical protein QYR00_12465 [Agrobacterium tumefaciens]|jgi:hypothetical protein|nr:hypothetical protein QYR00_12465 [Agrobacterium tumefaciens]